MVINWSILERVSLVLNEAKVAKVWNLTDQMTEQAHIIRGGKEPVTRLIVHKLHPSTRQC